MPPLDQLLPFALALAAAGVVQGALGFGFGIVVLSGAALVLPLSDVVPTAALLGVWMYGALLWGLRRELVLGDVWGMVVGLVAGVPVGVAMLRFGQPHWLLAMLGVVLLLGTAMEAASGPKEPHEAPAWAVGAGFFAGLLGGALGTAGPPIVLYVSSRRWSPARSTAALQLVFLGIGAVQLACYALSGLISGPRLELALWAAPAGGLGLLLGQTIFRRLPEERFRRAVRAGLAAMGLWFLLRALG